MVEVSDEPAHSAAVPQHTRWVRISHAILSVSVLTLAFSGFVILDGAPALYWGEVGNDLTPALVELPISRNYKHAGWEKPTPFFENCRESDQREPDLRHLQQERVGTQSALPRRHGGSFCPVSSYLLAGIFGGHFRSHMWPKAHELAPASGLARRRQSPEPPDPARKRPAGVRRAAEIRVLVGCVRRGSADGGQRVWRCRRRSPRPFPSVAAVRRLPVRAHYSFLHVRRRSLLFVVVHVVMVIKSGFRRQIRAMTIGE